MQASISLIVGLLLGGGAYVILGRRIDPENPPQRASALAWTAMGLGLIALLMVLAGLIGPALASVLGPGARVVRAFPAALSITFAFAAVVAAVGAIVKHDRRWPTWAALALGGTPAVFWIAFAVGELLFPHA